MPAKGTSPRPYLDTTPLLSEAGQFTEASKADLEIMAMWTVGIDPKDIAQFCSAREEDVRRIIRRYDPESVLPLKVELKLAILSNQALSNAVYFLGTGMRKARENPDELNALDSLRAAELCLKLWTVIKATGFKPKDKDDGVQKAFASLAAQSGAST